jgi:poly(A) polymerase
LIEAAMASTDARIAEDKPVTPAFLLAALLYTPAVRLAQQYEEQGDAPMAAIGEAAQTIISEQVEHIAIPRRFTQPMREIWEFQLRLSNRRNKKAPELVAHRRFRAAYDFLLLREAVGEDLDGLGEFWTEMQVKHPPPPPGSENHQDGENSEGDSERPRRRRRRRRPRKQ